MERRCFVLCTKQKKNTILSTNTVSESRTALNSSFATRNAVTIAAVKITLWTRSVLVKFIFQKIFPLLLFFFFYTYLASPGLSLRTAAMQMILWHRLTGLTCALFTLHLRCVFICIACVRRSKKDLWIRQMFVWNLLSIASFLSERWQTFPFFFKSFFKNNLPAVDFISEEGKCENKDALLG